MTSINRRVSACITGVAIVIMAPSAISQTMSVSNVSEIAESVTVRIESQYPGSGVLIKKERDTYTILTAGHVVEADEKYEIITPDGESYSLNHQRVRKFNGVDLAIVEFESSKDYSIAIIGDSTETKFGKPVYVAGFPSSTVNTTASMLKFSEGKVRANATHPLADGYSLIYSNRTSTGMSGGAVLNEQGKLVGIHGRAYVLDEEQEGGWVNVKIRHNLGIPINTYANLIQRETANIATDQKNILTADDYYLRGVDSLVKQDNEGAVTNYEKAIAIKPDYADAYTNRGIALSSLGNQVGAIADYKKAIAINPNDDTAYYNFGVARYKLGDKTGAIADYDKAIAINPEHADAYYNRGVTRFELGDKTGEIADYDKAIAINPDYSDAYYNRGLARSSLGDKAGAIADYDKAIAISPDYADAYYNRGLARSSLGDKAGAIADYDRAIAINPDYSDAYNNRGNTRYRLGDSEGAIVDYNKAIVINPNDATAYNNRGNARYKLGDKKGAITDFERAANLFKRQGNQALHDHVNNTLKKLRGIQ